MSQTSAQPRDAASRRPDLLHEWHPIRNGAVQMSDFSYGSNKEGWWLCNQCGHEYPKSFKERCIQNLGCSVCANYELKTGYNDLATRYSDLAREWHPIRNAEPDPSKVIAGGGRKDWWLCSYGHEWQTRILDRATGERNGCPDCAKVTPGINDLVFIYPELAQQWHPNRNGQQTPEHTARYSKKAVWWLSLYCGHEWDAPPARRKDHTKGCPFCAGKKVLIDFNDAQHKFPEAATLWDHENNDFTPQEIIFTYREKVNWRGECSHRWSELVTVQKKWTDEGKTCPYCNERKLLAGCNDLATKFPDIAAQWHPTCNGDLLPSMVKHHAVEKAWWLCPRGHDYDISIRSRTKDNCACPYCSGQRFAQGINDLATTHPLLAAEWHPTNNGNLQACNVQAGLNDRTIWWLCPAGHDFQISPNERTKNRKHTGEFVQCSICTGKTFRTGVNDLATIRPDLAAEWHPTKNGDLLPTQVRQWDSTWIYWLGKDCGHSWKAPLNSRSQGHGCAKCATLFSKVEKSLYTYLRKDISDAVHGKILDVPWGNITIAKVDIYLPFQETVVEYDGSYWHRDKADIDIAKTTALLEAGYRVIRVRHQPLSTLSISHENYHEIEHYGRSSITNIAEEVISILS